MSFPIVKICCISSIQEAFDAINAGASAIGLVGAMPSGPGIISDAKILEIASNVPPPTATFLLTSETDPQKIIDHHKRVHTSTIQIVDQLADRDYSAIRNALPNIKLVQAIHVLDETSIEEALELSESVDAILLDSGNPNLTVKELGGTGRTHNWDLSRKIVSQCKKPVFLAGGLKPENVREAIETVQPFGLDICSGLRTKGKLDLKKVESFFREVEQS
ncbi:MAG: phosphoribosylanthranilate isomerase [Acidobacteria bacterium]|nr:phosphoribosylanthranilate isomerase [Acidobacteriota bacterium]